jgi:hypothetical protein
MRISLLIIFVAISLVACSPLRTETPTLQVENVSSHVVSLAELGLRDTTRILVFDPKSSQLLAISNKSTEPIPNIQSGTYSLRDGIEMSPDHKWFAYLEISEGFNIQISSVDGTHHFMGIKNAVGSSFRWLTNGKIAVYNKMGLWLDCPSEIQVVDPFSKEINSIPNILLEGSQSPFCFPIPYFNPDFSKALYLSSEAGWQIYDYKTQSSNSVLPGLDTSPGGDKYFFEWGTNGLSFAIPDSDKITFARNVSENELTSVLSLEILALPEDVLNEDRGFDVWIPEKHIVGFDLKTKNETAILKCRMPKSFVVVDLATQTLKNYCLDRSEFAGQVGTPWFASVSADSRFVGWTIRELPSNEDPLSTVTLDTQTGNIIYLESYEFLGFGEISP